MKTPQEIRERLDALQAEKQRLRTVHDVNILGFVREGVEEDENFDENEHQREVDFVDGQMISLKFVLGEK